MKHIRRIFIGFATLAIALVGSGTPATADTNLPNQLPAKAERVLVGSSQASGMTAMGCNVWAFGYHGIAKCDSHQITCDFNGDGRDDQSWVVTDSRNIFTAWPGSGKWHQMPNKGKADDMHICYPASNGNWVVEVWVAQTGNIFYSWRDSGDGSWHGWYKV